MQKRTLAPKLVAGALIFSLSITAVPFLPDMGTAQTSASVAYAAEDDFTFDAASGCITAYKGSDQNVTIPRTIGGVSVSGIEWGSFSGNTSMTQATIPETVTSIGSMAFEGCTALTGITVPSGVTEIAPYTFYGCSKLSSVKIPNTVTRIMLEAFGGCTSLRSITIPASVTSIEDDAFSGIGSLTIIGEKGSYAESYAKNAGMSFTEAEEGGGDSDQAAADIVIAQIAAIGDVTLNSKDTVAEARFAYDALTQSQKALVTNLDVLTAAEDTLERLIAEAEATAQDRTAAATVIERIAALGTITLDKQSAIESIRKSYNALTDRQKALVKNYSTLTAAEAKLAELVKEQNQNPNQPKLTLSKTKYTLYTKGKRTLTLTASANGKKLGKTSVTWKSSKPKVASVSSSGKITAKKKGKTTISATYQGVTVKCTITVKKPTLKLKKSKAVLKAGKKVRIRATATPAKKITYRSGNKRVATVSKKGIVTAKKAGRTKITVTANGVKKRFTVIVSK